VLRLVRAKPPPTVHVNVGGRSSGAEGLFCAHATVRAASHIVEIRTAGTRR